MRDGLEHLARLREPRPDREAECGTAHARLLWSQGRLDEAIATAAKVAGQWEARRQTGDLGYLTVTSMLQVMLSQAGRLKDAGRARAVVAVGCMVERHQAELEDALPEVDLFLGASRMDQLVPALIERGFLDEAPPVHPGVRLFSGTCRTCAT